MSTFTCRVGTSEGSVVVRTIEAADERAARTEVERQGGRVFSIKGSGGKGSAPAKAVSAASLVDSLARLLPLRRGVKSHEFLIFNQELVALLKAGLPVVAGFDILLERQENQRFRRILEDIREQLVSGVALSDAFLSHGDVFPRLYSTSLKAGERSGEVEGVLRRYLSYQKILGSVKRKVTGALVYPLMLVALSIGLILVLMTYVIPRFTEFYAGFGTQLPLLTVIVVGTATFMRAHSGLVFGGVFLAAALFAHWKRTEAGSLRWDAILLRLPVVGKVMHQFALSQFTRSLATLVGAGTPLVSSLEIAAGGVSNRKIARAIETVVPKVREGAELWKSLEETRAFTSLTVEMVKVGESTGALEDMLVNVSEFYDEAIEAALQTLVNLIEPVILVVMGGVIATILLSVYLPMFTVLSKIQA